MAFAVALASQLQDCCLLDATVYNLCNGARCSTIRTHSRGAPPWCGLQPRATCATVTPLALKFLCCPIAKRHSSTRRSTAPQAGDGDCESRRDAARPVKTDSYRNETRRRKKSLFSSAGDDTGIVRLSPPLPSWTDAVVGVSEIAQLFRSVEDSSSTRTASAPTFSTKLSWMSPPGTG